MTNQLLTFDEGRMRDFNINEIWLGIGSVDGKKRPNVDDKVTDWDKGIYRVSAVINNIPTLELKLAFQQSATALDDSTSLISALALPQPTTAHPIYYNNSVTPHTLEVDHRLTFGGSDVDHVIYFVGDPGSAANIISEVYDGTGTLISNEVAVQDVSENTTSVRWRPTTFVTSRELLNGEIVTGIAYNSTGVIVSADRFMVQWSTLFYANDTSTVFLMGIRLESELVSDTDDRLIENNLGVPFSTTLLDCVLLYSDGSEQVVAIDGTKCVLNGLDGFDTQFLGAPRTLVLSYYPDTTEPFIGGGEGDRSHFSEVYRMANIAYDTTTALRVFPVPVFQDSIVGYVFKWYMTNVQGDVLYDVTPYVATHRDQGGEFSGNDYGTTQSGNIIVDMNQVAPATYPDHNHVQLLSMTLSLPGTNMMDPWLFDHIGGGTSPYGNNLRCSASNVGFGKFVIHNDITNRDTWLERVYYPLNPLYDPSLVDEPPEPSHFIIEYDDTQTEYEMGMWNQELARPTGTAPFADHATVTVRWILRTVDGDRILGWSPLLVYVDL